MHVCVFVCACAFHFLALLFFYLYLFVLQDNENNRTSSVPCSSRDDLLSLSLSLSLVLSLSPDRSGRKIAVLHDNNISSLVNIDGKQNGKAANYSNKSMNVLNSVSLFSLIVIPLFIRSFDEQTGNDDRVFDQLQKLIDAASDDEHNEIFLEQLTELLRNEEGLELVPERERRAIDDRPSWTVDGSGDYSDEEDLPPMLTNLSIVAFTMVSRSFFFV